MKKKSTIKSKFQLIGILDMNMVDIVTYSKVRIDFFEDYTTFKMSRLFHRHAVPFISLPVFLFVHY